MIKLFNVVFTNEADEFFESLDEKVSDKFIKIIEYCQYRKDPEKFKKLKKNVWEFRVKNKKNNYRLFAVWDKTKNSLVICTHGMIKKVSAVPNSEIKKAKVLASAFLKQIT